MASAGRLINVSGVILSGALLLAASALAQRQPAFGGAVCYLLGDLQEVMDKSASLPPPAFKEYWEAKKATGKCLFISPQDAPAAFQIEDANVFEREYEVNGKAFLAIAVRGKLLASGRSGFSFLQFQR